MDTEVFIKTAHSRNASVLHSVGINETDSDDRSVEKSAINSICNTIIPESRCIVTSRHCEDGKIGRIRFMRGLDDFGCTTHGYEVNSECREEAYVVGMGKAAWVPLEDLRVVQGCSSVPVIHGHTYDLAITKHVSPDINYIDRYRCRFRGDYSFKRSKVTATFVGWHGHSTNARFKRVSDGKTFVVLNFNPGDLVKALVQDIDIEKAVESSRTTATHDPASVVGSNVVVKARKYWFEGVIDSWDESTRTHIVVLRGGKSMKHDLLAEDAEFVLLPPHDAEPEPLEADTPTITWHSNALAPTIHYLNQCRHCNVCVRSSGAFRDFINLCHKRKGQMCEPMPWGGIDFQEHGEKLKM